MYGEDVSCTGCGDDCSSNGKAPGHGAAKGGATLGISRAAVRRMERRLERLGEEVVTLLGERRVGRIYTPSPQYRQHIHTRSRPSYKYPDVWMEHMTTKKYALRLIACDVMLYVEAIKAYNRIRRLLTGERSSDYTPALTWDAIAYSAIVSMEAEQWRSKR